MDTCVFCRIVAGELPAERLYEDESVVAFRDIRPQAPVHVLVVPRCHIPSLDAVGEEETGLLADVLRVVQRLARELGLDAGYRVVVNCGAEGGQEVPHLHFHLLGGRPLGWPPG
ncbi:MAG: histidine triad nucleotide-binding protein [Clostridia bacterium]|nr:histidine triad nucleotide-binding protein [Clostridia bacterium]